jgi:hypothetical protein
MLRVALERARPDTEWSGKISGLEFVSDVGGGAGAQASTGLETDTILTVRRSHLEHETDIEARDSASDLETITGKENLGPTSSSKQKVESV